MNENRDSRVCPLEVADSLDSRIRRWVHNPRKILTPQIKEGMSVLDLGCGPGFFTIDMAILVGESGRVVAADLQEGMLQKIREKINGTDLEERIMLHRCEADRIGLTEKFDFILLFYMIHEVPDQELLFTELKSILKPEGQILLIEPPFHVSKKAFEKTIKIAGDAGFKVTERPKFLFDKAVIFKS